VSVVFCDLAGSTALGERLDPEALRHVLGRYYATMRRVLESHGGLVEKFIGDAVVAVFGVPAVHEDDALRAVRAAVEMRRAVVRLDEELEREHGVRIEIRVGVNTGEAVAGDLGPGASFASGDAVNVAARLEQAAAPGEILVGPVTRALLGDSVDVQAIPPLDLRGKAEPVDAFRLLAVSAEAEAIGHPLESAFVGRVPELGLLRGVYDELVAGCGCRLVTVVGEPGIGKTRLMAEFASMLGGGARLLHGRCLPYGEGITYWPLAEIVRELGGPDALAEALAGDEQHELVRALVLGAIGAGAQIGSVEETRWAVRRLFEALGREQPLIVCLDDLHWAEPTFLQLVEYVAGFSTGAPILLLTAARDELLDTTPAWALPRPNTQILPLRALSEPEADALIDQAGPVAGGNRWRIAEAAAGNPLFLEQLLAHQAEDGASGELAVPPTIQALLAARLDRISTAERDLLERAAIEGVSFHRGTITALLPAEEQADAGIRLLEALRRNLIRPHRSDYPGDDGYRFAHVLVHDAVYQSMPKELRAQLHVQYATWLEQKLGARATEVEEILGYHLEQGARFRDELGAPDTALAERAGERLAAAGRRALARDDRGAGASLIERALELTRRIRLDVHLEADLAGALGTLDPARAAAIATTAAEGARAAGDTAAEAHARVVSAHCRAWAGEIDAQELERTARAALPLLEEAADHAGLAEVWQVLFSVGNMRGRWEAASSAIEHAIDHARRAGRRQADLHDWAATALLWGPLPADEALRRIADRIPQPWSPYVVAVRALLLATLGRFEEARDAATDAGPMLIGFPGEIVLGQVAILEGDYETAVPYLVVGCDTLDAQGNYSLLSTFAQYLGRALCTLGRYDEAEEQVRFGREFGAPDDVCTQAPWRQVQARVEAHRGNYAEAERLAREAVDLAEQTDAPSWQGDALSDLAQVLDSAGKFTEATAALEQALDRYERKHNWAMVAPLRPRLEELRARGPGSVPA
jgi:class 3 adenylate cyclase/tetratricopeptide (TPR) repeat protein